MIRKLVFALTGAAVVGLAAGCKDEPTSMKFDPAKANYTAGQAGQKGTAGGTAGNTPSR